MMPDVADRLRSPSHRQNVQHCFFLFLIHDASTPANCLGRQTRDFARFRFYPVGYLFGNDVPGACQSSPTCPFIDFIGPCASDTRCLWPLRRSKRATVTLRSLGYGLPFPFHQSRMLISRGRRSGWRGPSIREVRRCRCGMRRTIHNAVGHFYRN